MRFLVTHSYELSVQGLSDYGKASVIVEHLKPHSMGECGYDENVLLNTVTIWWKTYEEINV